MYTVKSDLAVTCIKRLHFISLLPGCSMQVQLYALTCPTSSSRAGSMKLEILQPGHHPLYTPPRLRARRPHTGVSPGPQELCHLLDAMLVCHNVALRVPQHVDEDGVVGGVQGEVLAQLRGEAVEGHVDHATPGPRSVHWSTLRYCSLHTVDDNS